MLHVKVLRKLRLVFKLPCARGTLVYVTCHNSLFYFFSRHYVIWSWQIDLGFNLLNILDKNLREVTSREFVGFTDKSEFFILVNVKE